MTIKRWLDRKLVLMVVGPIARTALTGLTAYLTGKGVPAEVVGQFGEAIAVVAAIGLNIAWDLVSKIKSENRGARDVLAAMSANYVFDPVRERFDRESV